MCSNFALKSGHVTQQVFSEDCTATGRPRSSSGMQNGSKLFSYNDFEFESKSRFELEYD